MAALPLKNADVRDQCVSKPAISGHFWPFNGLIINGGVHLDIQSQRSMIDL